MRKLTQKQIQFARKQFSAVEAMILENGGKRCAARSMYEFELQTICGTLSISLDVGFYIFSINCRFAEVRKAVEHFQATPDSPSFARLNPYSGKWNFNDTDATELVAEFLREIKPLLDGANMSI